MFFYVFITINASAKLCQGNFSHNLLEKDLNTVVLNLYPTMPPIGNSPFSPLTLNML